ncbi:single-stranded DNA-binding protein [Micromonospora sp. WMMD1102]|uniref:single-stranded DNA-binding protein n=1 Tax=Micromonospora sp. WMMD1102 TaxID=3016105 RepID=UPI00241577CC|nr:single-stranded DNA-binding protein [Micromonospora sp. WMMD1102]MDG4789426.1 single-stranded DNA-binding protein [Micromonospora sp. WMMD1102]
MFDTYVTIVGNVLTAPEWRRTTQSGTLVANFKVASTARRLDRESGRWVDGNSLRVRVNCWRKLAEGVASSVMVGDPVVVVGRLYTRDWTDDAGNHRTMYELEAVAVGHDLSRGRGRFARNRPSTVTSSMEEAEAEARVHGEVTESVAPGEAPALPDERAFDDDGEFPGLPVPPDQGFYPVRLPDDPFDGRIDLDGQPDGRLTDPGEVITSRAGGDPYGRPASVDEQDGTDEREGADEREGVNGPEDPDGRDGADEAVTADLGKSGGAGRGRRGRMPVSV